MKTADLGPKSFAFNADSGSFRRSACARDEKAGSTASSMSVVGDWSLEVSLDRRAYVWTFCTDWKKGRLQRVEKHGSCRFEMQFDPHRLYQSSPLIGRH